MIRTKSVFPIDTTGKLRGVDDLAGFGTLSRICEANEHEQAAVAELADAPG